MALFMFFLGSHAMAVQMLLMRELLAAFSGNELTIGAAFGLWFAWSGLGALAGRRAARFWNSDVVRGVVVVAALLLAVLPAVQVWALAHSRDWLGAAPYEILPFSRMLIVFAAVLAPTGVLQGLVFPCACRLAGEGRSRPVSRVYGAEALGALAGGLLVGWGVMRGAGPAAGVLAATALALAAVAAACRAWGPRLLWAAAAVLAGVLPVTGVLMARVESAWDVYRWRAGGGMPGVEIRRVDSPYQRLVAARLGAQTVLYANGQTLFMFPDPLSVEPLVLSVMARQPAARDVLVIGGNPVDFGRALLAFPDRRVTVVEADPWIARLTADPAFPAPADRARFELVTADPVSFARRAPAGRWDVIIAALPEPGTIGLNRYYTVEFYRSLARLLKPGGFLWTSVEGSEQLQAETGLLAASVWRTLGEVFPEVRATYGTRIGFFAAREPAAIPMDRQALAAAARGAGMETAFFDPDSFLTDEAADPEKRARVERALAGIGAPPNTLARPATHTLTLLRWNRFSGSGLDRVLWRLAGLDGGLAARAIAGVLAVLTVAGAALLLAARGRRRERGARLVLRVAVGAAGFSAMALELILIFLAQSLFGYVYERLAWLVTLFMAGLAAGAFGVRRWERGASAPAWVLAVGACGLAAVLAVAIPLWFEAGGGGWPGAEWVLHAWMAVCGLAVGALFPMANRLLRESGVTLTGAAGETQAADQAGAAAGALAAGLLLVPALGLGAACYVLALVNGSLALLLAAARPRA